MDPIFIVIDLFCGAGGTTTGFTLAKLEEIGIAKVIACVNHDHKAIKSHWLNNPDVLHLNEDIRTLDLTELIRLVKFYRSLFPNARVILWASLECTNFSKAKGGQPRDADSRTLADHLDRYVVAIDPDYIQIENVVEFMSWGPLDKNGKPVSRKNGRDWLRWKKMICSHGYYDEWREMNSADYGAYTSRNRLFGIFARPNLPIVWPEPTHAKNPAKYSMFGDLKKWNAVKEVLDFSDEGKSIFTRRKPLSKRTLERIYAGLIKYIAKGDTSFISRYYSGIPSNHNKSIDQPADAITCVDHHSLVQTQFLTHYYSNGGELSSIQDPAPVIPTKARTALIQTKFFIDKQYTGYKNNQSIEQPAGSIVTNDKHSLVQCDHFIDNPSHGGNCTSIDTPCPVIVARQDKVPLRIVKVQFGSVAVAIYSEDSEIMVKIKQFMAAYELVDIKMRMLRVPELLRIQGFPDGYKLEGTKADQKKFIGNSVVPHVVKVWTEALAMRLIDNEKSKVA